MPAYKYILRDGKTTKWYANFYYTDWTGSKKHVCKRGFNTQREAKEYERVFIEQLSKNCDITFAALVEAYLDDMKVRLKRTTLLTKMNIINTKILPYFENLKICNIDTLSIRKWQNALITQELENGEKYSKTYLKTIHNAMSSIMTYGVNHYNLKSNPCISAGSIGKSKAEEMKYWTLEQFTNAVKYEKRYAYIVALNILFYTGIREGELLALTKSDIQEDKRMNISKSLAVIKGEPVISDTKTASSNRKVSMPDFLYELVTKYIRDLGELKDNERLFMFAKTSLGNAITRIAALSGEEKIRVHDLRHSHASMLINMGVDLLEVSRRLGHKSIKTTADTYSHLYPEKDVALAGRISNLLDKE